MNINILDTKFKHSKWFKGSNLTKRQAIEYFAECDDFRLDKQPLKNQVFDSLFINPEDIKYEDMIKYCGKEKGFYRLSEEEKQYYIERRKFWVEFKKQIWENWDNNKGFKATEEHRKEMYNSVPEYVDYRNAYNNSRKELIV